ncbi:unnamed protein product [Miscanthus lutarioriparius]|uniref:Uncharacterized protein n=1 Tax=Miscanthus lutarioriparius TaxID=422564 RepID=A0A811P5G9_9POAL|nr:unnamed protein product [Miscanthus lutarioriparius]
MGRGGGRHEIRYLLVVATSKCGEIALWALQCAQVVLDVKGKGGKGKAVFEEQTSSESDPTRQLPLPCCLASSPSHATSSASLHGRRLRRIRATATAQSQEKQAAPQSQPPEGGRRRRREHHAAPPRHGVFGESKITEYTLVQENPMGPGKTEVVIQNKQHYKVLGKPVDLTSLIRLQVENGKVVKHEDWCLVVGGGGDSVPLRWGERTSPLHLRIAFASQRNGNGKPLPCPLAPPYSTPVPQSMRRLEVAALALLVAGAAAAALVLLLALCRDRRRRGSSIIKRPAAPELPLSMPRPTVTNTKGWRQHHHHLALLLLLCSGRRRARVAADGHAPPSPSTPTSTAAVLEEEVAAWRERWFGGPVSRALYTIYEEDEEAAAAGAGAGGGEETETPFYTPPTSPPRAGDGGNNGATAYAVPIQLTH